MDDYTIRIIREPESFAGTEMIKPGHGLPKYLKYSIITISVHPNLDPDTEKPRVD
jgi:hypothetical protein